MLATAGEPDGPQLLQVQQCSNSVCEGCTKTFRVHAAFGRPIRVTDVPLRRHSFYFADVEVRPEPQSQHGQVLDYGTSELGDKSATDASLMHQATHKPQVEQPSQPQEAPQESSSSQPTQQQPPEKRNTRSRSPNMPRSQATPRPC